MDVALKSMESWKGSGEKEIDPFYKEFLKQTSSTVFQGYGHTRHEGRLLAYGALQEFQDEIAGDPVIEIIPQGTVTLLLRRFMDSPPHGCTLVESDSAGLRVSTLNEEARAGLFRRPPRRPGPGSPGQCARASAG